jgi:hypothetical protein
MTGASSRRKGNRAEVEVARVLREAGFDADTSRRVRGGYQSGEDIVSDFPASIEVKNQARLDLSGWYGQATDQANGKPAIVVHKRVGKAKGGDWWVTTTLDDLVRIIKTTL